MCTPVGKAPADEPISIVTLADIRPGVTMKKIQAALLERNIKDSIEEGRNIIYETIWFKDVLQRQGLVLTGNPGYLEKTAIVIDLNRTGGLETAGQLYQRIQAELTRTFGAPATQEKGSFSPNIAADLRNGVFVRTSDWKTPSVVVVMGMI